MSEAAGSSGPSGWVKATPPQGKPPNGKTARSVSPSTQLAAANSGQTGSRRLVIAISAPAGITRAASIVAKPSHGVAPT